MGKRSNFERREADFYPTPAKAVAPLIPFLHASGVRTFAEPCCGEGDLVRHLESFGLRCVHAGDISTGQDALALDYYGACDAIITNPPHIRELMHRLIEHFQRIAPTWLLLDQDWSATKQAVPYLGACTDIIAIGRFVWIPGTKDSGKDNFAWYRFDARHSAGPVYHPFRSAALLSPPARLCAHSGCGKPYRPHRSDSRFCSANCRQRAHRERLSRDIAVTPAPAEVFRYVRHADVPKFSAEGWEPLPALDGTHHGEYSVLMRRGRP